MKDKFLSIRLTPFEKSLLDKASADKHISTSTFARSLLLTAINNDLNIMNEHSLTPELDKLDPRVRFALLRPLEIAISAMRFNNVPQDEIEKVLLFSVASEESALTHEFKQMLN